jgi:glycosyltransferase involved in cell wall biosynthesis
LTSNGTSRRYRVGIISNSFTSEAAAVNGGFIHVLEVAKRWNRWDVVFFAPESARAIVARELPNASFVPASPRYAPGWLRGSSLILTRLLLSFTRARELRACDAVITSTPFLSDVLPTVFARKGRVALIVQHLQTAPWKRPGNLMANAIAYSTERLGLVIGRANASLWFINDPAVAKRLSLQKRRAAVIQMTHGVDHLAVADFENELRSGALYVGRLHPTKGLDDLLRAWKIVTTKRPDAQLRMIGTGSDDYRAHLGSLVEELDLSNHVRFLGAVDETTKARELGRARVFAFPSLEEGWGIALAEAMTFGVPCVTYDLSAYRAVFTSGRVEILRRDIGAFASALLQLLEDEDLWSRLSSEGAALAKTFTWDRAAKVEEDAMTLLIDRQANVTSP